MRVIAKILTLMLVVLSGCNNDLYDDMPSGVSEFIVRYFPGQNVATVTNHDGKCSVTLGGGTSLVFGSDGAWQNVDGRGGVLPQVLLYDQLPPKLFEYLASTDNTENVYSISRDKTMYDVELLDYTILYNVSTGEVTGRYLPPQSRGQILKDGEVPAPFIVQSPVTGE